MADVFGTAELFDAAVPGVPAGSVDMVDSGLCEIKQPA